MRVIVKQALKCAGSPKILASRDIEARTNAFHASSGG